MGPREVVFVSGRLLGRGRAAATVGARSGEDDIRLSAYPSDREGGFVKAFWARQWIDELLSRGASSDKEKEHIVEEGGRLGILTPYSAILAQE